jgi:hypothetical protein
MRFPERVRPLSVVLVVTIIVLAAQVVTGGAVFGATSVPLLLVVPGYTFARIYRPGGLTWPELTIVTLGMSLTIAVIAGTVASPLGLSARTIAAVELPIVAVLGWLALRAPRRAARASDGTRNGTGRSARAGLAFVSPTGVLLIGLGIVLGVAGFGVASTAAQQQTYADFVQFWMLPRAATNQDLLGVSSVANDPVTCQISVQRPGLATLDWPAADIAPGADWRGIFDAPTAGETGPWTATLHCVGSDEAFDRRLTVLPPP